MFVDHLQLADFRSYAGVDVALGGGGDDVRRGQRAGQDESGRGGRVPVHAGSHRVSSEIPLVRVGAERALVRARVQAGLDDPRQVQIEVEITPGRANRARLNRSPLQRPRELLGVLRTVVFSPEDLAIVKADPQRSAPVPRRAAHRPLAAAGRRPGRLRPGAAAAQHAAEVASGRSRGGSPSPEAAGTLDVWDAHLAQAGGELLEARLRTLQDLVPHVAKAYADIAPTNSEAAAEYKTAVDSRRARPAGTS